MDRQLSIQQWRTDNAETIDLSIDSTIVESPPKTPVMPSSGVCARELFPFQAEGMDKRLT